MPFSFKPNIGSSPQGTSSAPVVATSLNQAPVSSLGLMQRAQQGSSSIIGLFLFALFGLTLLTALALVGYMYYLNKQIDTKKAMLSNFENQLGSLQLEDMRKVSRRLKIIDQIVKEYPSVNTVFKILEESTENQITYKRFNFSYNESDKTFGLTLVGQGPDYKSIVQQVETLKREPFSTYVSGLAVDNLAPDDKGNINFNLKMVVAIKGLLPDNLNLTQGAAEQAGASTQTQVSSTTASSTKP